MKKLKLLTLNIWRYRNWEQRKPILIKLLKKENPDIIFLQEAIYDNKNQKGEKNQVEQIANILGYKYFSYGKLARIKKDFPGEVFDRPIWFGNGIISMYPIKKSKKILLKHYPENNDKRSLGFLYGQINVEKTKIDVLSVHFLNNDKSSKLNLIETINWVKKNKLKPIIAGDFNIIKTKNLREVVDKDYEISYYKNKYLSYPVTEFSHNRVPVTLDYIISHKDKFIMQGVKCIETDASDHNAVVVEIEIIRP